MKEQCEQKVSHTAAALRFYVTATATKLREELAPLTATKEIEEDIKQKDSDQKKHVKALEDMLLALKENVMMHKGDADGVAEKHMTEISQHTKAIKVAEIMATNLQNSVASDISDVRETLRHDRAMLQAELADARAAAVRTAASNEAAIQSVANEISPLRQFRELILERLHVEKFVNVVREWQTSHIPQTTSMLKDLDERSRKLFQNQAKDHDSVQEIQRSIVEIRGHFKMFHAIATGLDDKPMPVDPSEDSRLPPIGSARGQRAPSN